MIIVFLFLKGIDTCAPILVTEIEEALLANIIASFRFLPSDRATHNPPQNVSPAAVVSTASTLKAGMWINSLFS